MIRRCTIVAVALSLLMLAACSEDNQVGTGVKVEKGAGGTNRLGVTTTTEAPATTAAPETTAAPATTARPAATTAPSQTTAPQAKAFVIEIHGDSSGNNKFDPPQAAVRLGTVVRWVNKDSDPRSVQSEDAGFKSDLLPPGGSFEYKTDQKGTFNYQDGTRPYAVGVLQVG